ncbi:hypothetical protein GCM10011369_11830 [Neiella marina]|uniref:Uncharacterized protein n=1 Tax=Neiella marina TaxID=508461 RepID=A0A8J2U3M9_9GAMM|nr:GNAT family N-acetyltransferase [Neiella marina]GGA71674.1 hypothetical protein GCM10011369_11830 [Neiella marina]
MVLTLARFDPKFDKQLLLDYQRTKYQVFYHEYGWHSLAVDQHHGIALLDDYDLNSQFFSVDIDGNAVGFLRGTDTAVAFPHASLFAHQQAQLAPLRSASLNALCVNSEYRGKLYTLGDKQMKLGRALLQFAKDYYQAEQFDLLLSSTNAELVVKVFVPAGFSVLEQDINLAGSPTPITNLCLALSSSAKQTFATCQ